MLNLKNDDEKFKIRCAKCFGSAEVTAKHYGYPEATPCVIIISCDDCDNEEEIKT